MAESDIGSARRRTETATLGTDDTGDAARDVVSDEADHTRWLDSATRVAESEIVFSPDKASIPQSGESIWQRCGARPELTVPDRFCIVFSMRPPLGRSLCFERSGLSSDAADGATRKRERPATITSPRGRIVLADRRRAPNHRFTPRRPALSVTFRREDLAP